MLEPVLVFRLWPCFIGGSPQGAIMATPGKIPKNISRKKIKKIIFKNIFFLSALMPPALLASMPQPFGQLITQIFSDSSALITRSSSAPIIPSLSAPQPHSPQDPQLPCAGCGQPPQLCRIFPAQPQLIGCAADIPGTASAPDQPGSTAPSLQIVWHSLSRLDALCCLSALQIIRHSSLACPILRASCPG